jgi:ABC-type spermidine/putrescine transport system permease subunit II
VKSRSIGLTAYLVLPIGFVVVFLLAPLAFTVVVSFWERAGLHRGRLP